MKNKSSLLAGFLSLLAVCAVVIVSALPKTADRAQASLLIAQYEEEPCTPEEGCYSDEFDEEEAVEPTPPPPTISPDDADICAEDPSSCEDESVFDDDEPAAPPPPSCTADQWSCDAWGTCSSAGTQRRSCWMSVDCETANTPRPAESRKCTPPQTAKPAPQEFDIDYAAFDYAALDLCAEAPELCDLEKNLEPALKELEQALKNLEPIIKEFEAVCNENACDLAALERLSKKLEAQFNQDALKKIQQNTATQLEKTFGAIPKNIFEETFNVDKASLLKNIPPAEDSDLDGIPNAQDKDPFNPDRNGNGIPDWLEANPNVPDKEDVALQGRLTADKQKLIAEGATKDDAEKQTQNKLRVERTKRKVTAIRDVGQKKFGVEITSNTTDTNNDGFSDEVAVALGVDPKEPVVPTAPSLVESKLYGGFSKEKCTTGVTPGTTLSANGAAILAGCPSKNVPYTLYALDVKTQKQTAIATKNSSENNKLVLETASLTPGEYILQVRPGPASVSFFPLIDLAKASVSGEASRPVPVKVLRDTVPQPIIKKISNVDVGSAARNIKVSAGADGRIHVTGTSDVTSMVVGTFSSAVFTSAMLADVEGGTFDIVSAQPLEVGEHEVVIYASRPEESVQSAPVKVRFAVVSTAQAAGGEGVRIFEEPLSRNALIAIGSVVGVALIVTIVMVKRRKKGTGMHV